jgi:hypothetical protein
LILTSMLLAAAKAATGPPLGPVSDSGWIFMRRTQLWAACLGSCLLTLSGCASPIVARYIYQDGEFGVVGIPVNTYQRKMSFREQAEDLMARHFPEGFEIVRAEEVNEGERILDVGRKTEVQTEPKLTALNQVFKLGKLDRTTSYEEKDKLMVRECRIIYRKKTVHSPGHTGQFAAASAVSPALYIDPNKIMREQITADMLARAANTPKKVVDSDVQKASASSIKSSANPIPLPRPLPWAEW